MNYSERGSFCLQHLEMYYSIPPNMGFIDNDQHSL